LDGSKDSWSRRDDSWNGVADGTLVEIVGGEGRNKELIDWDLSCLGFGMDSVDWVLEGSGRDPIKEGDDEDVVELNITSIVGVE